MALTQIQATDIQSSANISVARLYTTSRVGVGTNTPSLSLLVSSNNTTDAITLGSPTGGVAITNANIYYGIQMGSQSSGNGWLQVGRLDGTATAYNLFLQPAGGNVGIGTTSPTRQLEVWGAAGSSGGEVDIKLYDTTSATTIQLMKTGGTYSYVGIGASEGALYNYGSNLTLAVDGAYAMKFATNGAERARIDSNGNLGLGVTPSAWSSSYGGLELAGGALWSVHAGGSYGQLYLTNNAYYNGSNYIYKTTGAATQFVLNQGAFQWLNSASGTAANTVSFTQAMTLDTGGSLLVGVTSSPSNAAGPVLATRTFNGGNISSGNTIVTIASGPCAGVIYIAAYQNGVGTSMRTITFAKGASGTIVLASPTTAVVTADPIGSVSASSGNVAIYVTYNNTDLSYWINYIPL